MSFQKVPFGELDAFNVVVEIPSGEQKKYEYDSKMQALKLDGVLYDDVKFPFNYGYVAQTVSGDGEPLDAFVISTYPITRGTVVTCRAIGLIEVIDRGQQDHKIIAIPLDETRLQTVKDYEDLSVEAKDMLKSFYEELPKQWDRDIRATGFFGKENARQELLKTQILE